ncbi:MAG: hypothetical protein E7626_07670 [Ruminococcaceae bacterium]|nr:hypothetical protein [Oscillospiraceae bacterium]
MIKFVHTADLHLDSPFAMEDAQKAAKRRGELRDTFSRLIDEAKKFGAHFVFIAGDLFDRRNVTKNTLDLAVSLFASYPECKFIITPGNHDFYSPDSVWEKIDLPENAYVFKTPEIEKITFENVGDDCEKVNVFGYAFTSQSFEYSPLSGESDLCDTSDTINILCAHADIYTKSSANCPITTAQIAASGFDYVALGHVHNGGEIFKAGSTYYGYSGSLEGLSFHDCGERGAIFNTLEKKNGELTLSSEFVSLASRIYAVEKVNVTGAVNGEEIKEKVVGAISKLAYGDRVLLRVIVSGDVSPEAKLDARAIREALPDIFFIEIVNDTSPLFDCEYLAGDLTVKGAFFRELQDMLKSEDPRERAVAAKALRYGLAALSGGEVIDFE